MTAADRNIEEAKQLLRQFKAGWPVDIRKVMLALERVVDAADWVNAQERSK